jgi:hypothetical protein
LVDELIELVPGLMAPAPALPPAHSLTNERGQQCPPPGRWCDSADGELQSMATRLRQALPAPAAAQEVVHATTRRTLDALARNYAPIARHVGDKDIPIVLEERLRSYERGMKPLLRLIAIGVCSADPRHDNLWISVVDGFLGRSTTRRGKLTASSAQEFWIAAEAYPPLLVTYAAGVAGMAAGRDDLVYRLLKHPTKQAPGRPQVPIIHALALRHVVDPRHATNLPKWSGAAPYQALSVHLRQTLWPAFFNVLGEREYESSFENYEYLRSLLELHNGSFSSLGEFAVNVDRGEVNVHQRMTARLTESSTLLRSGAFDGDTDQVTAAWYALRQSARGRYP